MAMKSPQVQIPSLTPALPAQVPMTNVRQILANRKKTGVEQYLVHWASETTTVHPTDILSWHPLDELFEALHLVQNYLEGSRSPQPPTSLKRKSPTDGFDVDSATKHFSPATNDVLDLSQDDLEVDIYNGVIAREAKFIAVHKPSATDTDIHNVDATAMPTASIVRVGHFTSTTQAENAVRQQFNLQLMKIPGPAVRMSNIHDRFSPPLSFRFVSSSILGEGVNKLDTGTVVGCQHCRPHMGANRGCEYTKKCDCLEFAAVDEARLTEEQRELLDARRAAGSSETTGLPKRFPYIYGGPRPNCLVPFYLDSRNPIYECNENCLCGPLCKNRVVQKGRHVTLEIFRTEKRGWGLRCPQDLKQGQFIDTYRGEILTDAEATRREENSGVAKDSYLYCLDKFAEAEGLRADELYSVDGEFVGGPTRFMNHSCEPNCRQYTVSYNKYDFKIYEIAFFAARNIPAMEELTFDYLDKDEEDEIEVIPDESQRPESERTPWWASEMSRSLSSLEETGSAL